MLLTERKLEARVNELESYRYRDIISLQSFASKEDKEAEVAVNIPTIDETWSEICVGDTWKGRDYYLWMKKDVVVPAEWQEKTIVGIFDFGKTGAGNNSGFESLLYVNGKPYQGVDTNHKEVFFQKESAGEVLDITFRLWSGLEGGGVPTEQEHRIERASLAWLDEEVDDLYYNARVILETLPMLDEYSPEKIKLKMALNESFKLIDWSYPGSEEFYESLYNANVFLNNEIDGMDKNSLVNVTCIGHTHIDVAWLWRLKHTREKAARSFSTVLRLMEKYPDYVFLQTQPQLYEYIKNDYPEIYENMKEKIAEGKWEVDGGMWLEADCNLPSGESLVRQLLVGSRFIKDEFDKDVEYLWLPDVFGYSWALPQILKKSGIDTFMTTKISWNQYNRMPHDTFKWKGIDGSEVLTHFITTPEPWSQPGSWFYTYNGQVTPKSVKGVWDAYRNKELTQDLLLSYGYGDGGGGVNREMLEYRRRIDKMPGMPNTKTGQAAPFFRDLQEKIKNTKEYVHTWDGELYLEYHRGTYTSQAYNKKMNRQLELFYRDTEMFGVMNSLMTNKWENYPGYTLTEGWKIILRNQFHDIIPGSSIREVYEDSTIEYAEAEAMAIELREGFQQNVLELKENTWSVVNNANWVRNESVKIETEKQGTWYSAAGDQLQAQYVEGMWTVEVVNVPATGWTTITLEEAEVAEVVSEFQYGDGKMETLYYTIAWNDNGQITSIFHKDAEREVLAANERGNVLQMFEDKPLAHEAWDIDIFYQEKMREVTDLQVVELREDGPLKAVVHFEWKYMNTSISQDMVVYTNSKRIDFETTIDWREKKQLLKVAFPVDIRATHATYDVQYGNVERPTHWNTSWDMARFESVAHQWVDLSERNYGVSLLNNCKYGHDIKDNVIRLSLVKSATHPDPEQDQGMHYFTYSLLPHEGDFIEAGTVKEAWVLNQPLQALEGQMATDIQSLFKFNDAHIMVDAIKKAEDSDDIIIRFHEYSGSKQKVNITSPWNIVSWQEVNLMEKSIDAPLHESNEISVQMTPFEVKTIVVKMNK